MDCDVIEKYVMCVELTVRSVIGRPLGRSWEVTGIIQFVHARFLQDGVGRGQFEFA